MTEQRYTELEYRAGDDGSAGRISGVLMRYGTKATIWGGEEMFMPGAFGNLAEADVVANMQHDRQKPIARTLGGGLTLRDSAEQLTADIQLPDTTAGRDVAVLVKNKVLRGFSVEFSPLAEDMIDDVRIIRSASLSGLGVVDRPAYPASTVVMRQDGEELRGFVPYDVDQTINDRKRIRKRRVKPGAFDFTLNDEEAEIQLLFEKGKPLASRLRGSLLVESNEEGLSWLVPRLPNVSWARDVRGLAEAGLLAMALPVFRTPPADVVPDAVTLEEEEGNPGVFREVVNSAVLTGLILQTRMLIEGSSIEEG